MRCKPRGGESFPDIPNFSDRKTMQKLGISQAEYYRIKSSAYRKFILAFGIDEQVEKLDERVGMGVYE